MVAERLGAQRGGRPRGCALTLTLSLTLTLTPTLTLTLTLTLGGHRDLVDHAVGKGALAKVVPHQHQERRQLCHGSCTFGYSVQLDSAQPVWQMCCYSDWNRPNEDAPGLKRSGCNAIASQGDTVVPGQGVDTIRGLNPTYADRIETGMAATCCGTPFGQDPSGGSCASLGSPSPPPPAPPPLPSLSTTLLSPSPGCVGPEIQWPCLRKCHALGGTWPKINYQLPAVLVCKKSCAPLCPPPHATDSAAAVAVHGQEQAQRPRVLPE